MKTKLPVWRRKGVLVKGTGGGCYAICRQCPDPIDYHQNQEVATGSRAHVNRQVRIHLARHHK